MKHNYWDIIHSVKTIFNSNEFLRENVIKLYLIGNTNIEDNQLINDIDFVAFVKDSSSLIFFVKLVSELLHDEILKFEILINVFPIKEENMDHPSSMFVKNVLEYGSRIK